MAPLQLLVDTCLFTSSILKNTVHSSNTTTVYSKWEPSILDLTNFTNIIWLTKITRFEKNRYNNLSSKVNNQFLKSTFHFVFSLLSKNKKL